MKKIGVVSVLVALLIGASSVAEAKEGRGGLGGLLVGCCFGVRTAGAFNEGQQLHFRDWARLVPYVGVIFAVWDGVEGAKGMTASDLRRSYGAVYY